MATIIPKSKRGPGKPPAGRTANPDLIWQRMRERGIRTIPELGDRIGKLVGRPIHDCVISRLINGKRQSIVLQRAIARVLGLELDAAFPKDKPQITQISQKDKGRTKK